ncbi:uncharacterized protein LOC126901230 isoform X2 [Daktulosphaira vitifoliae]|uniref:uncharacterized protein LOC126901230 isoform X2 n=1 Tax=Daktulosphaira vitifoliae TaxID=58002 RepID=UPI0021AA8818|nr:uncharacterized protein LOC126901230 isoform X2 [Daktulosphaira vitifoliae]
MFKNVLLCTYLLASIITIKVYGIKNIVEGCFKCGSNIPDNVPDNVPVNEEIIESIIQLLKIPFPPTNLTVNVKSLLPQQYIVGDVIDDVIKFIIMKSQKQDTILYVSTYIYNCVREELFSPLIEYLHNLITSKEMLILVNVHIATDHWVLGVIDLNKKQITILDSQKNHRLREFTYLHFIMCAYFNVKTFHAKSKLKPIDSNCQFILAKNAIQQKNSYDCGLHVCLHAFHYITNFGLICADTSDLGRKWLYYCYTEYEKYKETITKKSSPSDQKPLNEDNIKKIIIKTLKETTIVQIDQVIQALIE